jgi:hypothetical protein
VSVRPSYIFSISRRIHSELAVNNFVDIIDPIGAPFDPRTPNSVEVLTYIVCNPDRSPRDKSIKYMKSKEDAFEKGYDSDGELGPFNNTTIQRR